MAKTKQKKADKKADRKAEKKADKKKADKKAAKKAEKDNAKKAVRPTVIEKAEQSAAALKTVSRLPDGPVAAMGQQGAAVVRRTRAGNCAKSSSPTSTTFGQIPTGAACSFSRSGPARRLPRRAFAVRSTAMPYAMSN